MSHAVLQGAPAPGQLYLDQVLKEAGGQENIAKLLYHCLKIHPDDIMMINGYTGKSFTNCWILSRAVQVARALRAKVQGQTAVTVGFNDEQLVATNLGCLLAGVVPLALDPNVTIFEFEHFFNIWPPSVVFCNAANREEVELAANKVLKEKPVVVVLEEGVKGSLDEFIEDQSHNFEDFKIADVLPTSTAVLLPTSGSTGPAKAALITHRGLVAQIYCIWMHYTTFPRPEERALLLSSATWMTWWNLVTSVPVCRITLVMTPKVTAESTLEIIKQFQVTWALTSPALAARLRTLITPAAVASIRNWLFTGASISVDVIATIQANLQEGAFARQGYGMTELHGFFSIPNKETPYSSVGVPGNIFHYKIIDDDGKELGPNKNGELLVKSDICVIKGYYNNEEASRESISKDGWLRTGDIFYNDDAGRIYFVERKKFWFKCNNFQVSPEEVEAVISTVPGVELCVVCGTEEGAAALVIQAAGLQLSRQEIHDTVNSKLSSYKRLHGGIAFVSSLPLTHSGKLNRRDCQQLTMKLLQDNLCFK